MKVERAGSMAKQKRGLSVGRMDDRKEVLLVGHTELTNAHLVHGSQERGVVFIVSD